MRAGDLNNDNVVNVQDVNLLIRSFGCMGQCAGDLNNDQVINAQDFNLLRANFGVGGAPPIGP